MIIISDKTQAKTYYFPKEKGNAPASTLKLFSELSKNEYTFNISGITAMDLYYPINVDFSKCNEGEYDWSILDSENNILQNGVLRIGEYNSGEIIYDFKEEYIVFNPETGEGEVIEYGDCTDVVNEAYYQGFNSGKTVGYETGYESGLTQGFPVGYQSGRTDGWNAGYESGEGDGFQNGWVSGHNIGLEEGFEYGYGSGYTEGYQSGYTNGYESGASATYEDAYQAGYQAGHTDGEEEGFVVGYNSGYTDGSASGTGGWESGYTSGYTDGYSSGWTDGYSSGSTSGSPVPPVPPTPSSGWTGKPFRIEMLEDGDINWAGNGKTLYQINGGDRQVLNNTITGLSAGDIVEFTVSADTTENYSSRVLTATGNHNVMGNIMSLNYVNYESATTLIGSYAYKSLFYNNTKLISAENLVLPALTLTSECYSFMFQGCTNLTKAPVLPAPTLYMYCYYQMFADCSNLTYIKCLATNVSAVNATTRWVNGIYGGGTFVKSASMNDWTTGTSGIPSNWNILSE